jgi:chromosome segregation ATPase
MSVKEAVLAALKELVLPELQVIRHEQAEFKAALALTNECLEGTNKRLDDTNKRLDDLNLHLIDQSRRIDQARSELLERVDLVRSELVERIDAVRSELTLRQDETIRSVGRLYEVIVRKDEHEGLVSRVSRLEKEVATIKKRVAA